MDNVLSNVHANQVQILDKADCTQLFFLQL